MKITINDDNDDNGNNGLIIIYEYILESPIYFHIYRFEMQFDALFEQI